MSCNLHILINSNYFQQALNIKKFITGVGERKEILKIALLFTFIESSIRLRRWDPRDSASHPIDHHGLCYT